MTWNILAELYSTASAFSYCESYVLAWAYRRQRILKEILTYKPDIVCLQVTIQPLLLLLLLGLLLGSLLLLLSLLPLLLLLLCDLLPLEVVFLVCCCSMCGFSWCLLLSLCVGLVRFSVSVFSPLCSSLLRRLRASGFALGCVFWVQHARRASPTKPSYICTLIYIYINVLLLYMYMSVLGGAARALRGVSAPAAVC